MDLMRRRLKLMVNTLYVSIKWELEHFCSALKKKGFLRCKDGLCYSYTQATSASSRTSYLSGRVQA